VSSAAKQSELAPELLPLAARSRLSEQPHQGHQLPTAALHPGIGFAISYTATELRDPLYDFRGGPLRSGYFRDFDTGLDYAMNRFHNPGTGRFMTPDPYMNSAGPTDPESWNRYAYTRGDPVNRIDPNGTCDEYLDDSPYDSDCGAAMEAASFFLSDCDASCQEAITFGGIIQAQLSGQDCSQVTYSGFQGLGPVALPGCGSATPVMYSPAPPIPIYCEPDVIAAMAKAWQQTQNGMSGREAGFAVNGSSNPGSYRIVPTGANTSNQRCQAFIQAQGNTFAIFHVHPDGCEPQPSSTDIMAAQRGNFDIYTFSHDGLWEYDPTTGDTTKLRNGLSWLTPCD
jgi:RHS repeat-associated protein